MGFMGSMAKAGIAKKVWNEARKPKNQAKAKQLFNKVTGKGGGTSKAGGRRKTARAGRRG